MFVKKTLSCLVAGVVVVTLMRFLTIGADVGYQPPDGKNLLDPTLFYSEPGLLYSIVPVDVDAGETYMFSMPSFPRIDDVHIVITSENRQYVDEDNLLLDMCSQYYDYLECLIEVDPADSQLYFTFTGPYVDFVHEQYNMENFQLEIGETRTAYEPFIASTTVVSHQGQGTLTTSYETTLTLEAILSQYVSVHDDYDGGLDESIVVVEDEYTGNENVVGTYAVSLEVSDSSDNRALFDLTVAVVDLIPPLIHGPTFVEIPLSEDWDHEQLMALYSVEDGYTPSEMMTLEIVESDVPESLTTTGEFTMWLRTEDESGNTADKHVTVSIVDDMPPHISGPRLIDVPYYAPLTWEMLVDLLEYHDANVELTAEDVYALENGYEDSEDTLGTYRIVFAVTDGFSEETHTMYVRVIDDVAPVFSFDERIVITEGTALSAMMLLSWFNEHNESDDFEAVDIRPLSGFSFHEPLERGIHTISVEIVGADDQTLVHTVNVEVLSEDGEVMMPWLALGTVVVIGSTLIALGIVLKRRLH